MHDVCWLPRINKCVLNAPVSSRVLLSWSQLVDVPLHYIQTDIWLLCAFVFKFKCHALSIMTLSGRKSLPMFLWGAQRPFLCVIVSVRTLVYENNLYLLDFVFFCRFRAFKFNDRRWDAILPFIMTWQIRHTTSVIYCSQENNSELARPHLTAKRYWFNYNQTIYSSDATMW